MITFRYAKGHVAWTAYTVAEVIAFLQTCQQDLPVFTCWEGQHVPLSPEATTVETMHAGHPDDARPVLLFDVNWT